MFGYPIRIDSNNPTDHDNFVVTDVVKALDTTDVGSTSLSQMGLMFRR